MRIEDRLRKEVGDGYGWIKLPKKKKIKYVERFVRGVITDKECGGLPYDFVVKAYAGYLAGRIQNIYIDEGKPRAKWIMEQPIESVIATAVIQTREDLIKSKASFDEVKVAIKQAEDTQD
jgi:hypothetical protein